MHRLQIPLDERQYEKLRARAAREGKSVSALLRAIVADYLGRPGLHRIEGIAVGPGQATDHDRVIYDEE